MKLQVKQAGGAQELTIGSQKEFLQLWNRGVIAADDLVRRGDRWVRAAELPWIEGMARERKRDGRRLFWITLILMLLGLAGVLWIRSHAALVARKSGRCRRAACGRCRPTHGRQTPMPTKAIWEGKECDVRRHGPRGQLERQHPLRPVRSGQPDRRPAVPVMIKLRAKTRWLAMDAACGR